jgi:hypothetical protein
MLRFYKSVLILFFVVCNSQAQEATPKVLKGKVIANSADLEGIYIANLTSNLATLTENGGYFSIPTREGDTLLFSSVQFKGLKLKISKSDLEMSLFFVKMETLMRELDEVRIDKNINAVSLGLVSKNQKKYTPAERKLYTATGGGNQYGTNTKVSLDGILNAISGRTTMLKKEILVEKKEILLLKITNLYQEKYFTETLKIPPNYVKAFHYYIVENKDFAKAIKDKNKTLATFIMNGLATEYLALLNEK